jgi:Glycosyl transferase family 2
VITLFHIYYNQQAMLKLHRAAWSQHAHEVSYLLIDDGSPRPIAGFEHKNLTIARIEEDIPWNIAGARNLGFSLAKTDWVLGADIDHVIGARALSQILALDFNDANVAYTFSRRDETGNLGCETTINLLMNKQRFFEVGGYDEDFSGHYGREETFFYHCLRRKKVKIVSCKDIVLDWYPQRGATRALSRSKATNTRIFDNKMIARKNGTYQNGPILRFKWKIESTTQVDSMVIHQESKVA